MPTKAKSPEQIMKANLAKTMGRLKTKVASAEDLWLEWFSETVQALIAVESYKEEPLLESCIVNQAGRVADLMLDVYEERWGKGE